MTRISRQAYAEMYGPTVGDRVRLADTELFIEVEEDRTVYGDEVKFGGGKVIRDGMGQSQQPSAQVVDVVTFDGRRFIGTVTFDEGNMAISGEDNVEVAPGDVHAHQQHQEDRVWVATGRRDRRQRPIGDHDRRSALSPGRRAPRQAVWQIEESHIDDSNARRAAQPHRE